MSTVQTKMSEEQAVNLVRNALLVAGMEMGGKDGDHWPVIKSTIHSLAKDYENYKIECEAFGEIKKYYAGVLRDLDAMRKESPDALKIEIDLLLEKLHEVYDACFTDVQNEIYLTEETIPEHMKRAATIIKTMGEDDV